MLKKIKKMMLCLLILGSANLSAFDGVFEIEVLSYEDAVISRGTGFMFKAESNEDSYMVTSFHVLNSVLLNAKNIRTQYKGAYITLAVLAYDELNDIMILDSRNIKGGAFYSAKDCSGVLNVAAYIKGEFVAFSLGSSLEDTTMPGVKKVASYLKKGFSGTPLLNEDALVCGMVVLSSESNSSSLAVSKELLEEATAKVSNITYSISDIRVDLGVEKVVSSQAELDFVLINRDRNRQYLIKLTPNNVTENFIIKDAKDLIIESSSFITRILVHNSSNIMLRNLSAGRAIINQSNFITVNNCNFNTVSQALLLKDSQDIEIEKNTFSNIDTAIVIQSSQVDNQKLISLNVFKSVINSLYNI